ncbi:MAG TPA: toll/interleukin-1 receptor domain-containing protein [Thermoanaerobaculia bacterium]|nr:toll/interleukin-1 receptor domain-containing protein [Thermoanaerobaculia bacterium]
MPDQEFQYQVFISYSSQDREWAHKIEADLRRKGVERIFIDERSLEAGTAWAPELEDAVQASRHLLLLWSKAAAESQWVNHEMAVFDVGAGRSGRQLPAVNRKTLCVLLEGESKVLASLQNFTDLRDVKAYATGIGNLNDQQSAAWNGVVDKLTTIIFDTEPATWISLALLAMTRPEADTLDINETILDRARPLGELITALGFANLEALKACYGPARKDWRPFGGQKSLRDVLSELEGVVNSLMPGKRLRFQEIEFVSLDIDEGREEIVKLQSDLSVILIDPLSLYHRRIYDRFGLLRSSFDRDQSLIMTLAPFNLPPFSQVRELLRRASAPMLDPYYEPKVPSDRLYPFCRLHACDPVELTQMLRLRLGRYAIEVTPQPPHPVLDPAGGAR